jgi:hypothetical protein
MVSAVELGALATARGVEFRRSPDEIIVTTASSAAGLVDLCQDLGIVILGLDGLREDGAVVVPLIDFIADFSGITGIWESRVYLSASEAGKILRAWRSDVDLIEFTLDGLDE